jgi:zinc transport system substrate-binding protein
MVRIIQEELSALYPNQREIFKENADSYIAQINQVDGEILTALEKLENKNFVVFHPAFGYLADDYGLVMFSLEEEGKEATPQHLEYMIDLAKAQNIKVIFYQAEIDASQSRAYAEEIGGTSARLEPLSLDYVNNLRVMAEALASVSK